MLQKGVYTSVRDGQVDVKAVVLARGNVEKMEPLETVLSKMAQEGANTSDISNAVDKRIHALDMDEISSSDDEYVPLRSKGIIQKEKKLQKVLEYNFNSATSIPTTSMPSTSNSAITFPITSFSATSTPTGATMASSSDKQASTDPFEMTQLLRLILAEMRVQTTLQRKILSINEEQKVALSLFKEEEQVIPAGDAEHDGIDGRFSLSSIKSENPCVFARNFMKKKYSKDYLTNKIMCPKGKTTRIAFPEGEVADLKTAVESWYGNTVNWKLVVASVNQFIRDYYKKIKF